MVTPKKDRRGSYTVREFCARHSISKSTYYELKRKGLGPQEMRLETMVRISVRAEAEWVSLTERSDEDDVVGSSSGAKLKRPKKGKKPAPPPLSKRPPSGSPKVRRADEEEDEARRKRKSWKKEKPSFGGRSRG